MCWQVTAMVAGGGDEALVSRGDRDAASHPNFRGLQATQAVSMDVSSAVS